MKVYHAVRSVPTESNVPSTEYCLCGHRRTDAAFYCVLVTSPLIDVGYFPASRYITLSSESREFTTSRVEI